MAVLSGHSAVLLNEDNHSSDQLSDKPPYGSHSVTLVRHASGQVCLSGMPASITFVRGHMLLDTAHTVTLCLPLPPCPDSVRGHLLHGRLSAGPTDPVVQSQAPCCAAAAAAGGVLLGGPAAALG